MAAQAALLSASLVLLILPVASLSVSNGQNFVSRASGLEDVSRPHLLRSGQLSLPSLKVPTPSLPGNNQLVVGLFAAAGKAADVAKAKLRAAEEAAKARQQRLQKFARSVDEVVQSTVRGFVGPWVLGFIFGSFGGLRSGGLKGGWTAGVSSGNTWGLLSASFVGVETLAQEIRGTKDKWNNVCGACGAGAISSCSRGPQAMLTGCVNFAAMSYIVDLLITRQQGTDQFQQFIAESEKAEKGIQEAHRRNPSKGAA